ncbi:MAG: sulfotransferase domain-containing protein [Pseudomonadales bacterium]|jgi:aryl sulfotransferase
MREYKTAVFDNRRWQQFRPRPDDIFVCTPAKCGTTWTQSIVVSLLFPEGDQPGPTMMMSPWIEAKFVPEEIMHPMLEAQTHRRVMKSHTAADGIPWFDDAKYIVVGRDGRDVFMSMCNHLERMKMIAEMNERALADGVPPMPEFDGDYHGFYPIWLGNDELFFNIIRSYWERREQANVLLVHFADLKSDLAAEMRRIADFLDIELDAAQWPDVVDRCTFEGMRGRAEEIGDFGQMFKGGAEGFLFKGTNGRWRDALTEAEVAAYDRRASEVLSADMAAWLEGGRRAVPA